VAAQHNLESIAFCCISIGEFRFPKQEAVEIAVKTVTGFLNVGSLIRRVVFNVFKDNDYLMYRNLLMDSHKDTSLHIHGPYVIFFH
jgi:O-acetyl-ADP-ribose deacetylase (regulator of RNase III)